MSETKQITISSVLKCLKQGMDRQQIAEHFEISATDCKRLFQHEKLKGRKPLKQPAFTLVDDTVLGTTVTETVDETVEEMEAVDSQLL